jgi:hypothetical protein
MATSIADKQDRRGHDYGECRFASIPDPHADENWFVSYIDGLLAAIATSTCAASEARSMNQQAIARY